MKYISNSYYRGACLFKRSYQDKEGNPTIAPLYFILKFCSKPIISFLDDSLKSAKESTYKNPKWNLDFSFLIKQHKMLANEEDGGIESANVIKRVKKRNELARTSLLLKIQKYDASKDTTVKDSAREVLDHPVTKMYIHQRWEEMKWIFYFFIMFMHFIYSLTFTTYSILLYHDLCPLSLDKNYYSADQISLVNMHGVLDDFKKNISCNLMAEDGVSFVPKRYCVMVTWISLILFTVIVVVREIMDFIDQKWQNLKEIDTWIHFFMVAMGCICLCVFPVKGEMTVYKFQHHAAVWGIFATWIQMLVYMERTPRFGLYVHMFAKVAKTVLSLFWAFLSLLAAFAFTFYLLFPSNYAFDNDIPSVFVKVK